MNLIAAKAVDSIFHKPNSVFVTATVREILWTGLPVDCTVTDFQGKAVCTLLAENEGAFIVEAPGKYRFSLFGAVSNPSVVPGLRLKNTILFTYFLIIYY